MRDRTGEYLIGTSGGSDQRADGQEESRDRQAVGRGIDARHEGSAMGTGAGEGRGRYQVKSRNTKGRRDTAEDRRTTAQGICEEDTQDKEI